MTLACGMPIASSLWMQRISMGHATMNDRPVKQSGCATSNPIIAGAHSHKVDTEHGSLLDPVHQGPLMRVADVMSREVELVSPDATLQEAATLMAEYDVGAVLIGADGSLEGILTDRDILLRAVVNGLDPTNVKVREVMSSTLFTCTENDTLEDAFREMSERQVRRLPVLDVDGRLAGIVTLSDLVRHGRDPRLASEVLRELAEPHRRKAVDSENGEPGDDDTLDRASEDAL